MIFKRVDEIKEIMNLIESKRPVFLYSKKGTGKTKICNELLQKCNEKVIKIKFNNLKKIITIDSFLDSLCEELDKKSYNYEYLSYKKFLFTRVHLSFFSFILMIKDISINQQVSEKTRLVIPFILLLKLVFLIFPSPIIKKYRIQPNISLNTINKFLYIQKIFKTNSFLIYIQDIELFDEETIEYIADIISSNLMIIEYNNLDPTTYLNGSFSSRNIKPIEIRAFTENEIKELAKLNHISEDDERFIRCISNDYDLNFLFIREKVSLDPEVKILLYILSLFENCECEKKLLLKLYNYCFAVDRNILKKAKDYIRYTRFLPKQVKLIYNEFDIDDALANTIKLKVYNYLKNDMIEKGIDLTCFFELFKNLNYEPLFLMLDKIAPYLRNKTSSSWQIYLKYFDEMIQNREIKFDRLKLVDLMYSLNLYEKALYYLSFIEEKDFNCYFYEIMLKNRLEFYQESINLINYVEKNFSLNAIQTNAINHMIFLNYASINRVVYNTNIDIAYKKLLLNQKQHSYFYALRNSYVNNNIELKVAIKNTKKAAKHFKRISFIEYNICNITLSMLFWKKNDLKKAKKGYLKIINNKNTNNYELSIALNNYGITLLRQHNYECITHFKQALILCNKSFTKLEKYDSITICGNLLVAQIRFLTEKEDAKNVYERLKILIKDEKDPFLLRIAYSQIGYYLSIMSNISEAKEYYEKANKMVPSLETIKYGDYILGVLAFWHFNINLLLKED